VTEPDDIRSTYGEVILYATEDGRARVECRFADETLWLSQAAMMDLFQTTKQNVSLHLRNIFREGELSEAAVVKDYLTTAADGGSYQLRRRPTVRPLGSGASTCKDYLRVDCALKWDVTRPETGADH
jgi:hypothetical protein